jgi:hypothetical protein
VNNLVTYIEQIEQGPPSHHGDDEDADVDVDVSDHEVADADNDARNCHRYNFNHHGMGGNNHGNSDCFAKMKFSLPSFAGNVNSEAYLDWDLVVQ